MNDDVTLRLISFDTIYLGVAYSMLLAACVLVRRAFRSRFLLVAMAGFGYCAAVEFCLHIIQYLTDAQLDAMRFTTIGSPIQVIALTRELFLLVASIAFFFGVLRALRGASNYASELTVGELARPKRLTPAGGSSTRR
jgi:hypothetical protein